MDNKFPPHYKVPRPATTDDPVQDVMAVMWQHADFFPDQAAYQQFTAPATPGQRAICATAWYIVEVENGGHEQFFSNSTGAVWPDALEGLRLLGAEGHAQILAEALALFPNGRPALDHAEREAQLAAISLDALQQLDERLFEIEQPYEAYAERYINAHPDQFFLPFL